MVHPIVIFTRANQATTCGDSSIIQSAATDRVVYIYSMLLAATHFNSPLTAKVC